MLRSKVLKGLDVGTKCVDLTSNNGDNSRTAKKASKRLRENKVIKKIKAKKRIGRSTVQLWMTKLGFKYSDAVKTFYTDNHEKEEVVRYKNEFVRRYLLEYEPYMLRWIQVPLSELKILYSDNDITVKSEFKEEHKVMKKVKVNMYDRALSMGKTYTDGDKTYVEFHVDSIRDESWTDFHTYVDKAEEKNGGLVANQSYFRKDKGKPVLISFGQDEVIFKQFLLNKKCWYNKDGQFKCRPKDDGSGIMWSEYQSREYGFGFSPFQN